jgi:hypothetical protein
MEPVNNETDAALSFVAQSLDVGFWAVSGRYRKLKRLKGFITRATMCYGNVNKSGKQSGYFIILENIFMSHGNPSKIQVKSASFTVRLYRPFECFGDRNDVLTMFLRIGSFVSV